MVQAFEDADLSPFSMPVMSDSGELCYYKMDVSPGLSDLRMIASDVSGYLDEATKTLERSKDYAEFTQVLRALEFTRWRPGQLPAVASICANQDVVCTMPPGAGKSAIYQIAGLHKRRVANTVTVVITPLISLMKDQYKKLIKHNVYAIPLYGDQRGDLRKQAELRITDPQFLPVFIFLTPERLCRTLCSWLDQLYNSGSLGLFVLDEAQVVFEWGSGYRPAYLKVKELRSRYPHVPQLALSGTLSPEHLQRYISEMHLKNCLVVSSSPDRPNLFYHVHDVQDLNVNQEVIKFIKSEIPTDASTIVYCRSPRICKNLQEKLRNVGIYAALYHGKLSNEERDISYELWYSGHIGIMIATIAFGMGIDKKDVRFILHMNLPKDLSAYIQETGRAGRDGKPATCVLFYRFSDSHQNHWQVLCGSVTRTMDMLAYPTPNSSQNSMSGSTYSGNHQSEITLRERISASHDLLRMCASPRVCRRTHILRFYSPHSEVPMSCNSCDVCIPDRFGKSVRVVENKEPGVSFGSTGRKTQGKIRKDLDAKRRTRGSAREMEAIGMDPVYKRRKFLDSEEEDQSREKGETRPEIIDVDAEEILDVDTLIITGDESNAGDHGEDNDVFHSDSDSEGHKEHLLKPPRNSRPSYRCVGPNGLPYLGASNLPCARVTYTMAEELFCAMESCRKPYQDVCIQKLTESVEKRVSEMCLIRMLGLRIFDGDARDSSKNSSRITCSLIRAARLRIWKRIIHGMILQNLLIQCLPESVNCIPQYANFYVKPGIKALECFEEFDILL